MNFDKLPCDIKSKIYNINKIAEKNEVFKNSHQTYFNNVLIELKNKNMNKPIDQLDLRHFTMMILKMNREDVYNAVLNGQGCETPEDRLDFEKAIVLKLRSWRYNVIDMIYPYLWFRQGGSAG